MIKTWISLLIISCVLNVSLSAKSSVWKVSTKDSMIYIGGTIHILRSSDYPLPKEFDAAYQKADKLIFETDLTQAGKLGPIIMQKGQLKGKTLSDVLSPEAYKALSSYCSKNGIPLQSMNHMNPSIVMISVTMVELRKLGLGQTGVDMHYFQKGLKDGKDVGGLETIEEHANFITSMGEIGESKYILQSLKELDKVKEMILPLLKAWKSGDTKGIEKAMVEDMKTETPKLYQSLFVDRNNNWMPHIQSCFKTPEVELILVGAGHLVGNDGLITKLKKLGYTVEQLDL